MNTKKILIELRDFIDKLIDKIDEPETPEKKSLHVEQPPYRSRSVKTEYDNCSYTTIPYRGCGSGGCGGGIRVRLVGCGGGHPDVGRSICGGGHC